MTSRAKREKRAKARAQTARQKLAKQGKPETIYRENVLAVQTVQIVSEALQMTLGSLVPVVERHQSVKRIMKGQERDVCGTCKVLHPCPTYEALQPLSQQVEDFINERLATRTQVA